MARCETCGNEYDKAFQVTMNGSAGALMTEREGPQLLVHLLMNWFDKSPVAQQRKDHKTNGKTHSYGWFSSPHLRLGARMMRTSEPPHQ